MTSKEIIKKLERDGWKLVNVVGSHHKFKHPTKSGAVTVIHPNKDFAIGTLKTYIPAGRLGMEVRYVVSCSDS